MESALEPLFRGALPPDRDIQKLLLKQSSKMLDRLPHASLSLDGSTLIEMSVMVEEYISILVDRSMKGEPLCGLPEEKTCHVRESHDA